MATDEKSGQDANDELARVQQSELAAPDKIIRGPDAAPVYPAPLRELLVKRREARSA